LKYRWCVTDQLTIDIKPHAWTRANRDLPGLAKNGCIAGEMFTQNDLRGQHCYFGGAELRNQDDLQLSVSGVCRSPTEPAFGLKIM